MESHPVSWQNLIGLPLAEARKLLSEAADASTLPVRIVESAPPQRPLKPGAAAAPAKNYAGRAPCWGEWRVLRCLTRSEGLEAHLEIVVAREELRPL